MRAVREVGAGTPTRRWRSPSEIHESLRRSGTAFASALEPAVLDRLLEGGEVHAYAAGAEIYEGDAPRIGMLVEGTARTYLHAWDGRQVTLRHTHPGAMLGKSPGSRGRGVRLRMEAETACTVVELDRPRYFEMLEHEPGLALRVHAATVALLNSMYDALAINAFGSIRDRVVHVLLELAETDPASGEVTVTTTQQQLADDIGSTREVVGRALAELARDGMVTTGKGRIGLRDPVRLANGTAIWIDPTTRSILD